MVNILCDEYRWRKKVWQNRDKNQCARKKIRIAIMCEYTVYSGFSDLRKLGKVISCQSSVAGCSWSVFQ